MSQARTNARRRRQAANGFSHLAPQDRPNYKKRDASASAKKLARTIASEKLRQTRKGMKK